MTSPTSSSYDEDFNKMLQRDFPKLWTFFTSIKPARGADLVVALTNFTVGVEAIIFDTVDGINTLEGTSTPPADINWRAHDDVQLSPNTKSFIFNSAQPLTQDGLNAQSLELPFSKSFHPPRQLVSLGRQSHDSSMSSVNDDPSSSPPSSVNTASRQSSLDSAAEAALSGFQHILAPARPPAHVPHLALSTKSFPQHKDPRGEQGVNR
ncbi:hypothetical protein DXG01_015444 [Tephrocybe rancida]|nr:hypothetical protein DXG01_015444 [Tephrocybe rancida]